MTRLIVTVEGMALWVARETHYDVIFPKTASGDRRKDHYPVFSIGTVPQHVRVSPEGVTSALPVAAQNRDLRAQMLDLLTVCHGVSAGATPDWMLRIPVAAKSPVFDSAHCRSSSVAMLRLPLRAIRPIAHCLQGPVTFSGRDDVYLSHGTTWEASIENASGVLLRSLDSLAVLDTLELPPVDAGNAVHIRIVNATAAEHKSPGSSPATKKDTILTESLDMIAVCGVTVDAPVYKGADLTGDCCDHPYDALRLLVSCSNLCPQSCPDVTT